MLRFSYLPYKINSRKYFIFWPNLIFNIHCIETCNQLTIWSYFSKYSSFKFINKINATVFEDSKSMQTWIYKEKFVIGLLRPFHPFANIDCDKNTFFLVLFYLTSDWWASNFDEISFHCARRIWRWFMNTRNSRSSSF